MTDWQEWEDDEEMNRDNPLTREFREQGLANYEKNYLINKADD